MPKGKKIVTAPFIWGNLITEALRYDTRCKGSHGVTSTPTLLSGNGKKDAFVFPAEAGPHFTDPEGTEAWVNLVGWLHT